MDLVFPQSEDNERIDFPEFFYGYTKRTTNKNK